MSKCVQMHRPLPTTHDVRAEEKTSSESFVLRVQLRRRSLPGIMYVKPSHL